MRRKVLVLRPQGSFVVAVTTRAFVDAPFLFAVLLLEPPLSLAAPPFHLAESSLYLAVPSLYLAVPLLVCPIELDLFLLLLDRLSHMLVGLVSPPP